MFTTGAFSAKQTLSLSNLFIFIIRLSPAQLISVLPFIPFSPISFQEATADPCLLKDALPAPQTSKVLT